ncbi:SMC-Scp complex subunit ScpB [Candidatus Pacearchaeota archaeon CG_4_10_14_0_2_um_filter_31_10]|nr:MAG: SMC-Scp complex subunit ScpB [Candidatus Pacearchaeota archaeon CG10_big_fil_rev_8_21_14_0_10_31_59]PIZ80040.1 MAG: SMC-Scp complex subunit ScpB [Candidatus Pacearchaeota archaeon CG_4_10_14_0_2_um_filter_31_10]
MEENNLTQKIEAILFIAARFLTLTELVRLTDINPLSLKEALEKLKEKLNNDENSALKIVTQGEDENLKYKMDVKPEFHYLINKLASGQDEFTKAEQETLAIIAYKQPVKQSLVIKIRGNKGYDHIKHFMEAGLLKAKKLGHTYELNLSEKFYDYFSINKKEKNIVEK